MTKSESMLKANIEKNNYDRINKLLQVTATPAVKRKFDTEFDPSILKSTLNKSYSGLGKLKKQRVINQHQWTLLFPKNAAPSSSDFDLTLMICLLRNFTEMDKSDIFPMETDTSDAASLLRLKHYRNNIVHSKTFALSDDDFKQYWEHINSAVCKLGGESYREMCLQLKCNQLEENKNKYEKDCDKCTRTRPRRKLDITHREIFSYNGSK